MGTYPVVVDSSGKLEVIQHKLERGKRDRYRGGPRLIR